MHRALQCSGAARWLAGAAFAVLLVSAAGLAAAAERTTERLPRMANGKPDFSGIWQTNTTAEFDLEPHAGRSDMPPGAGIVVGNVIPYLPAALAQRAKNFAERATADPRLKCYMLGTPRGIYYPEPFQVLQQAKAITVLFEFGHAVRTIYTNGTGHNDDLPAQWLGDSRGHWEGDVLVVDVNSFNDKSWLDRAGNHHSDGLHVVERWSFVDRNTIRYQATLDDAAVYSRPWSLEVLLHRHRERNFQLIENYCFTHEFDSAYPLPSLEH